MGNNLITKPFFSDREKVIEAILYKDYQNLEERLKSYKYDLNKVKVDGKTAFQYAFEKGCDMKKIFLLASYGADLNQNFKNDYYSPIHYAVEFKECHKNNFEILRFLVKNRVDIDKKNCYDITPLQMAVKLNSLESTEILLINGAKIDFRTNQNLPLHHSLVKQEREDNFEAINDELLILQLLLKYGLDKNSLNKDNSLISLALSIGKNDLAKYLIFKNANLNIKASNRLNIPLVSAFLVGLHKDNFDIIKTLLNNGADIKELNQPLSDNKNSHPPLILALIAKKYRLAKYLIKSGIDVNVKSNGVNAIFWAKGNRNIYKLLKKYGAKE